MELLFLGVVVLIAVVAYVVVQKDNSNSGPRSGGGKPRNTKDTDLK